MKREEGKHQSIETDRSHFRFILNIWHGRNNRNVLKLLWKGTNQNTKNHGVFFSYVPPLSVSNVIIIQALPPQGFPRKRPFRKSVANACELSMMLCLSRVSKPWPFEDGWTSTPHGEFGKLVHTPLSGQGYKTLIQPQPHSFSSLLWLKSLILLYHWHWQIFSSVINLNSGNFSCLGLVMGEELAVSHPF